MYDTTLTRDELIENLNCLSKAELLDVVYNEVFNDTYDDSNADAFNYANNKATHEVEQVEDLNCVDLVNYIIDNFMC